MAELKVELTTTGDERWDDCSTLDNGRLAIIESVVQPKKTSRFDEPPPPLTYREGDIVYRQGNYIHNLRNLKIVYFTEDEYVHRVKGRYLRVGEVVLITVE